MHLFVTFLALYIVSTQTTPISDFDSDLSNDSLGGPNGIDPIDPTSPPNHPTLEAQTTAKTQGKLYVPQDGVGYRAPKNFICPGVEESGSHQYCGYFNRYYYLCERGLRSNCYLGWASPNLPSQICVNFISPGTVCVLFDGTQKPFRIDESDLDLWKHKDEPLEDPTKPDNKPTSADGNSNIIDYFRCSLGFC